MPARFRMDRLRAPAKRRGSPATRPRNESRALFQQARHRWLAMVARDDTLPPSAYRVAVLIWDWMNVEKGYAWPSFEKIARELRMDRSTAIRAIGALRDRSWLHRTKARSNHYRLSFGPMNDRD